MQVQNNKEEVPFAHYEEKFRALDPVESAKRCGVPFADITNILKKNLMHKKCTE